MPSPSSLASPLNKLLAEVVAVMRSRRARWLPNERTPHFPGQIGNIPGRPASVDAGKIWQDEAFLSGHSGPKADVEPPANFWHASRNLGSIINSGEIKPNQFGGLGGSHRDEVSVGSAPLVRAYHALRALNRAGQASRGEVDAETLRLWGALDQARTRPGSKFDNSAGFEETIRAAIDRLNNPVKSTIWETEENLPPAIRALTTYLHNREKNVNIANPYLADMERNLDRYKTINPSNMGIVAVPKEAVPHAFFGGDPQHGEWKNPGPVDVRGLSWLRPPPSALLGPAAAVTGFRSLKDEQP